MDPWAAALNHWTTPPHGKQPATCDNNHLVFDHQRTAVACQRELDDLGHPRQRIQPCPLGTHYHLHCDPHDPTTVKQGRARRLLWLLTQTGDTWVERLPVRDEIGWGKLSAPQKRKHFNRMLTVLKKHGLVVLDDTRVRVEDRAALTDLVHRIGVAS